MNGNVWSWQLVPDIKCWIQFPIFFQKLLENPFIRHQKFKMPITQGQMVTGGEISKDWNAGKHTRPLQCSSPYSFYTNSTNVLSK